MVARPCSGSFNRLNPFPYYQQCFPAAEFKTRHRRIYEAIGRDAIAVLQGGGPDAGFVVFRQTNDFFYLTGVEVPQAYLLLDGRRRRATLYLPHRDEKHAASEGREPAAEDTGPLKKLTGCDAVRGLEKLTNDLDGARHIHTPLNPAEQAQACQDTLRRQAKLIAADPWDARPSRETRFIRLLKRRSAGAKIHDLSPLLTEMRLIKSRAELAVMRRAGELTAQATIAALRATRPGMYEYELGAVADAIFRRHGANGPGYRPIIATGRNIWQNHYYRNNIRLKAGDLVLFDYAPDLCNYTSDIGRMWPVNGRYNRVQRELYGFMVRYHLTVLKHLRPHVLPAQVIREAAAAMEPYMARTKFSKPIYEQAARRVLEGKAVLTHPVGMAVHDVGSYCDKPFQPGLVFALDPQMWVPEEKLYIRVEDTVAITSTGVENLTPQAPHELDEIESVMKRG